MYGELLSNALGKASDLKFVPSNYSLNLNYHDGCGTLLHVVRIVKMGYPHLH